MTPTLLEARRDFINWRQSQGYAKATVKNDEITLRRLAEVIGWQAPVDTITPGHLQQMLDARHTSPTTSNMRRAHLSMFVRYCRTMGFVSPDFDPLVHSRRRPVPQVERKRVDKDAIRSLIEGAENYRERILLAVGLNLCLRISEVSDLRIKDVDFTARRVSVRVFKTGLVDSMPMTQELEDELRRYITWYTIQVGELKPDYYLIPTTWQNKKIIPTKPMSRPADAIKRNLQRIGWDDVKGEGGHTLRRTGARWILMSLEGEGEERAMRVVQQMLHHKTLSQTEHYLGITVDKEHRDRVMTGTRWYTTDDENVVNIRRAQ
jgi:integrase